MSTFNNTHCSNRAGTYSDVRRPAAQADSSKTVMTASQHVQSFNGLLLIRNRGEDILVVAGGEL